MTLFKQIALLLSILLLTILTTVLVLNFNTATHSVQERLYEDAKNTATSLSLSLGSAKGDESIMSTMINANFDSGHYTQILLVNNADDVIYVRNTSGTLANVPTWFSNFITLDIPIASAQVSSGWNPIGILYVKSDNSYAYEELYMILTQLLISFAIIMFISLVLLYTMLHLILKPLVLIQKQAEAIMRNEFIRQENIPHTTEFRDVVKGMNQMVDKVEDIFEKGNSAMASNKDLLYKDTLTSLHNRKYMTLKLPQLIGAESKYNDGTMVFIAIKGLIELNKTLGHQKTDDLLKFISKMMLDISLDVKDSIVSRMNGTEFAILFPGVSVSSKENDFQDFYEKIIKIKEDIDNADDIDFGVDIGITSYKKNQSVAEILSRSDYALSLAKSNSKIEIYESAESKDDLALGKETYRNLFENALENDGFELAFWDVYDNKNKKTMSKIISIILEDENNSYSFGQFIAPAIELGFVSQIYIFALKKLFSMQDTLEEINYSIRLSPEFITDKNSFSALQELFELHPNNVSLTFEFPDHVVIDNLATVKGLAILIKENGYNVSIEQFAGESDDYNYLKEIKPTCIKADISYLCELIEKSAGSLASLQVMTDSIGVSIVATSVKDKKELTSLVEHGIEIIQGPIVEDIS